MAMKTTVVRMMNESRDLSLAVSFVMQGSQSMFAIKKTSLLCSNFDLIPPHAFEDSRPRGRPSKVLGLINHCLLFRYIKQGIFLCCGATSNGSSCGSFAFKCMTLGVLFIRCCFSRQLLKIAL